MADITKLKSLIDSYGVAVRAGVITPCIEDEKMFRDEMGLPEMSAGIKADWAKTDGVRKPITLSVAGAAAPAQSFQNEDKTDE
jgi:hypothetical protein